MSLSSFNLKQHWPGLVIVAILLMVAIIIPSPFDAQTKAYSYKTVIKHACINATNNASRNLACPDQADWFGAANQSDVGETTKILL